MPRTPDIHGDRVVFSAEGNLWLGSLSAGTAERITSDEGVEINPRFSPDGKWIAFTGGYDGGTDVYVMSIEGGAPRRLTYDPTRAEMVAWSPDGKSVLFRSRRSSGVGSTRLYSVPVEGGNPQPLPMEKGAQASYSPDGAELVYTRLPMENHHWKRYHGGEANAIWIADLPHKKFSRIDKDVVNEQYPVWVGKDIFYVSERDGTANLWRYNTVSHADDRVTSRDTYDVNTPASDGHKIIYQWGNELWVYDIATGKEKEVKLSLVSDMIHARPYTITGSITSFSLGPTGKRVAIMGRGQIFTAPAESGDIRSVALQPGSRSKDANWSPDGKWIAYVSDRSGEENIWVAPSGGDGEPRQVTKESKLILDSPLWCPDSKHLIYRDLTQTIYLLDTATGNKTKIDQSDWGDITDYMVSPDGKWIAYSKPLGIVLRSLYLYNIESKTSTRVTFPPTIDQQPSFDPAGKYLYFESNRGLTARPDDFDFQMDFLNTTKLYAVALAKDTPDLIPLTNDEEPGSLPSNEPAKKEETEEEAADKKEGPPKDIKVDLDGISNRIIELPVTSGNLKGIYGLSGSLMYIATTDDGGNELKTYTFKSKKEETVASNILGIDVSPDAKKMAIQTAAGLQIGEAGHELGSEGKVDLSTWKITVDPVAEWHQIFLQAWRQHRDVFYDPMLHGQNWEAVRKKYEALLPSIGSRGELNEIIGNMQGEMNVSHEFVGGGSNRRTPPPSPGVASLGADLSYDKAANAYKITNILAGDGFDASARSPLLTPGLNVQEGDYLLSINGKALTANEDPNKLLVGEAGHVVRLEVNSKPSTEGAKIVRIKAMASDAKARYYNWVGANRNYVTKYGGPNIAYIHIPDMESEGMQEFTKHFYSNLDKDGMVIDVRYNHGGDTSGQILERLRRVIFEFDQPRYGVPQPYHRMGYLGKVVVLCNEGTSSDGEYFCTGFRYEKLGPVVGTRTWGGFMAVGGYPTIDGATVTTPVEGSFTPEGKWLPDGTGFTPDYIVEEDPNAFVAGRDPQMDKALELLKAEIQKDPPKWPKRILPPSKEKAFGPNHK
jgi:tricorn protease